MVASPYISILIKALNEEDCIGECLDSVMRESAGLSCEIILADSLSTDRTVEIARRYPIKIVQFERKQDRSAGAAAQLAYQHAQGQLIYMLDGDMVMQPGFLREAVQTLEQDQGLAGVGGVLSDTRVNNMFDRHRVKTRPSARPGAVPWLNGGGLYRKAAVDGVGYFSHRFLPAYEEAELGMRLRNAGWRLWRLARPGVSHTGHDESTSGLLMRHWRNGYAHASAMLLKGAVRGGYLPDAIRINREPLLVIGLFLLSLFALIDARVLLCTGAIWFGLFFMLLMKKRNLGDAAFSFMHWHYRTLGVLVGLFKHVDDPKLAIPSKVIQQG